MAYWNSYSGADIIDIKLMVAEGKTYREIGEKMGRSRKAVASASRRLGLNSKVPVGGLRVCKAKWKRPYTEDELVTLRHLASLGKSRFDIAGILGRTIGSINGTCAYYKIKTSGGPGGTPSHRS